MNVEEMIKECEQLKFESDRTDFGNKQTFPHIVSQDSFEKLIMNADDKNSLQRSDQQQESSKSTGENSSIFVNIKRKDSPPQMFQQTSVIKSSTSIRNEPRKRSMHRQRNIDESVIVNPTKTDRDKNNNNNRSMSIDNAVRTMSLSNTNWNQANIREELKYRPYNKIPYASLDQDYKIPHTQPGMLKSKSLEIPAEEQPFDRNSNLPKKFNSFQYEEETARRYLNSLNITNASPLFPHGTRHGSAHDNPRENMSRDNSLSHDGSLSRDSSFSDSPTSTSNNSPMGNSSPLRRLQEHENFNQSNTRHKNINQSSPIHQMHLSRSYEQKQAIHHKYTQRKSYSVNSSPYDIIHRENNMRRIFSEEIVPEHPSMNETRSTVQQHMRRAASYDLASYVRHPKVNHIEKLSGSVGNFHQQSTGKPATKILFPQHDNVKRL